MQKPVDPKLKNGPSHFALRKRKGKDLCLPFVEAEHLLDALSGMGWVQSAGMGFAPLSAAEIYSWACLTRTEIAPWEFAALRAASSAYCTESASSTNTEPATRPPEE